MYILYTTPLWYRALRAIVCNTIHDAPERALGCTAGECGGGVQVVLMPLSTAADAFPCCALFLVGYGMLEAQLNTSLQARFYLMIIFFPCFLL